MGTNGILLHRKSAIREAVKAQIIAGVGQNELVQLSFSNKQIKSELRWEHANEFEYRGEMYDIVKSEQRADSITYWCIHDQAETQINRQLEALTAAATGSDQQQQNSLGNFFHFLKSLFCEQSAEAQPIVAVASPSSHFYLFSKQTYSPLPTAPPPEA